MFRFCRKGPVARPAKEIVAGRRRHADGPMSLAPSGLSSGTETDGSSLSRAATIPPDELLPTTR